MTAPDVLVVGGGLVGAAVARSLALCGATVEILDDGTRPGASSVAAAGMLAPFSDVSQDDPVLTLKIRGRDLYRELLPELEDETGIHVQSWRGGIVHVAFTHPEADALRAEIAW